jgi:hypothetical protein
VSERPLRQPLVTRPAYGEGNPALPKGDERIGESGLPGGGPSNKGLPLDSGIPGSSTHDKDEKDVRDFDNGKDESLYRTDNADDLLTNRDRIDFREDNADKHDGIGAWGKGEWDSSSKTKWPYRDGLPNTVNASAEFVLARWEADQAPTRRIEAAKRTKIAVRLDAIVSGLNPKFVDRSKRCAVSLKRSDGRNLRWILAVDCGNGSKVVKIKGNRDSRVTKLSKMDLDLSCSCPAWRWQGPEHHSKREDYLDGKPRGTASVPVIRDPQGINRVCKHVAAVLAHVKNWNVAKKEI